MQRAAVGIFFWGGRAEARGSLQWRCDVDFCLILKNDHVHVAINFFGE